MAEVALRAVVKRYQQDVAVLHGISCDIADGEFVVIVGPSGCGKSTLLRMVAGLETITGGEIAIDGKVVNDLEPKDRDIAMVFQNYALYPHMSVYDNMAYGLKIRGLSKADIRAKVEQAADILQIRPYLDRKPRALSGGQRQRVAMGRAIVRDPKVFLFDEPLSNLDAKLRVQMRVEIKHLQQRLGVTAIYVTHDQVEAMTLADRLIVMNAGHAEQIGAPLELYARPETVFVAGFIGSPSMNFLPGRLAPDGRSVEVGTGIHFALDTPMTASIAGAVTVGIRPEHLVKADTPDAGCLTLTVSLVEALGADTLVYGQPTGALATTAAASPLVARLDGGDAVKIGDTLAFRPAPGALHLFDAQTGKRL